MIRNYIDNNIKCLLSMFGFLLLIIYPVFSHEDLQVNRRCSCETHASVDTLVVSSLDGIIIGINALNGEEQWSFDSGQGALLSSTLDQILIEEGDSMYRVIPSLDGNLYKLYDESILQGIPLSADALLSSSLKIGNDAIAGGKDIRTFGLDALSGKLMYECGSEGCHYFDQPNARTKLIIRRTTQTVRAVDAISGFERWNMSVSHHSLASVVSDSTAPSDCQSCESAENKGKERWIYRSGDFCPTDKRKPKEADERENGDIEFRVVPPSGEVKAFSKSSRMLLWTKTLESPIAQLWLTNEGRVKELSIFDPRLIESLNDAPQPPTLDTHALIKRELDDDSMVYVGTYNEEQYVIVSEHEREKMKRLASASQGQVVHADTHLLYQSANPSLYFSCSAINPSATEVGAFSPPSGCPTCTEDQANALILRSQHSGNMGWYLYKHNRPGYLDSRLWGGSKSKKRQSHFARMNYTGALFGHSYWSDMFVLIGLISGAAALVVVFMVCFLWRVDDSSALLRNERTRTDSSGVVMVSVKSQASMSTVEDCDTASPGGEFVSRYLADFEPVRCLGKGGFGVVFESRNKLDDCKYAVKRIAVANRPTAKERVMREVKALAKLDHVGIVRYYQSWFESPPPGWQEHTDARIIQQSASATEETEPLGLSSSLLDQYATKADRQEIISKRLIPSTHLSSDLGGPEISASDFPPPVLSPQVSLETNTATNQADDTKEDSSLNAELMDFNQNELSSRSSVDIVFGESSTSAAGNDDCDNNDHLDQNISPSVDFVDAGIGLDPSGSAGSHPSSGQRSKKSSQSTPQLRRRRRKHEAQKADANVGDDAVVTSDKELQTPAGRIYLYIQMQLCHEHTLRHWLAANDKRDLSQSFDWFRQIVAAVQYVHDCGLIHRDLKPSNIFFSLSGQIKVGDFGLVTAMMPDYAVNEELEIKDGHIINHLHTDKVGTHLYMSPEQWKKGYTQKVDIFALGLIFFELMVTFGTEMERIKTLESLRRGLFPKEIQSSMPKECDFVHRLIAKNPDERPNCQAISGELQQRASELFCHNLM